ncbi:MAG: alpha/beta fold hydrolase [Melioribacteraceae bacterium]
MMIDFDPVTQDEQYDPGFPSTMVPAMFEDNGFKYLGTMFIAAGEGPHPLIILLHGFPGNEANYDLAQVFRRQGFNVFVFHYRGCWGSTGDYLWSNLVEDVSAGLKFVKSRPARNQFRIDSEKIILIGHSMGGFAALFNCIRNDEIKHAVSIAGFNAGKFGELIESSRMIFEYSAQHMQPAMDFVRCESAATLLNELIANKKEWNLLNYLEKLSEKNLLIIGSKHDTTAPMDIHHKPLMNALNAAGAKKVTEYVLETGHSFSDKRIALARIISEWLGKIKF